MQQQLCTGSQPHLSTPQHCMLRCFAGGARYRFLLNPLILSEGCSPCVAQAGVFVDTLVSLGGTTAMCLSLQGRRMQQARSIAAGQLGGCVWGGAKQRPCKLCQQMGCTCGCVEVVACLVLLLPLLPAAAPMCSAEQKTGYAIHMYTANMSMEDSCLANADGDMLIVPQQGTGRQAGRVLQQHPSPTGLLQAGRQAGCYSSTRAGRCVRGCATALPPVRQCLAASRPDMASPAPLLPLPSRCFHSFLDTAA